MGDANALMSEKVHYYTAVLSKKAATAVFDFLS